MLELQYDGLPVLRFSADVGRESREWEYQRWLELVREVGGRVEGKSLPSVLDGGDGVVGDASVRVGGDRLVSLGGVGGTAEAREFSCCDSRAPRFMARVWEKAGGLEVAHGAFSGVCFSAGGGACGCGTSEFATVVGHAVERGCVEEQLVEAGCGAVKGGCRSTLPEEQSKSTRVDAAGCVPGGSLVEPGSPSGGSGRVVGVGSCEVGGGVSSQGIASSGGAEEVKPSVSGAGFVGVRSKSQRKREQRRRQKERESAAAQVDSARGFCETVCSQVVEPPAVQPFVAPSGASGHVPVWRRKARSAWEGVASSQSSCPSYGQAMSEAEKEAKDSLARRRAAENAVAERLAKMKLESLQDEQKCQEYADLKKQRLVQWRNESVAKSQASLDKCKSIDPESSASQYEIRMQAKLCEDQKFQLEQVRKKYAELHGAQATLRFLDATRPPGTETDAEMDLAMGVCDVEDGQMSWMREKTAALLSKVC